MRGRDPCCPPPELTNTCEDLLHIHRQSAYLVGRDKAIVDIPLDHPSCSKQHAVIQRAWSMSVKPFTTLIRPLLDRSVPEKDEFGNVKTKIKYVYRATSSGVSLRLLRPFIIDLESTNGTHVNDGAIPTSRYYELRASDGSFAFGCPNCRCPIIYVYSAVIKFGDSPREYVLLHDEAS